MSLSLSSIEEESIKKTEETNELFEDFKNLIRGIPFLIKRNQELINEKLSQQNTTKPQEDEKEESNELYKIAYQQSIEIISRSECNKADTIIRYLYEEHNFEYQNIIECINALIINWEDIYFLLENTEILFAFRLLLLFIKKYKQAPYNSKKCPIVCLTEEKNNFYIKTENIWMRYNGSQSYLDTIVERILNKILFHLEYYAYTNPENFDIVDKFHRQISDSLEIPVISNEQMQENIRWICDSVMVNEPISQII